jgi:hypothetical protein
MSRLYNYDDDPADAAEVETWQQMLEEDRLSGIADSVSKSKLNTCVVVFLLLMLTLAGLGVYLMLKPGVQ